MKKNQDWYDEFFKKIFVSTLKLKWYGFHWLHEGEKNLMTILCEAFQNMPMVFQNETQFICQKEGKWTCSKTMMSMINSWSKLLLGTYHLLGIFAGYGYSPFFYPLDKNITFFILKKIRCPCPILNCHIFSIWLEY